MKLPLRQLLAVLAMVGASLAVVKARDAFAPTDLDLMGEAPGILVYQAPLQKEIEESLFTFEASGARLVPEALFEITGVVLAKRRYLPWGEYHFAPWDIGIGWGPMSDPSLLEQVTFWQGGRFMHYRHDEHAPVTKSRIVPNSANLHVIPADGGVRDMLADVRPGNIVRLSGFLVDVEDGDTRYQTSLSRHDTGAGSTEILYVQSVDLDPV